MPLPPYLYSYDPVGTSPANKILDELHNVAPPNNPNNANFIVPRAAPFFKNGLIVRTGAAVNSPQLVEGTDYILTHPFIEASVVLNKLLYGSIMFLDRQYSGDVYLTYQTIGAGYTLDDYGIVESLTNSLYNIRLVSWTQIEGLPLSYPGMPHTHNNYADMVGLSEVVNQLTQLVTAVQASGGNLNSLITSFQQHISGQISHTKAQIGLANVPNYPVAEYDDLVAASNSTLMTPHSTARMIALQGGVVNGPNGVPSDGDKVDKTTTVTGGGLATGGGDLTANRTITVSRPLMNDLVAGTNDNVALTPLSGVHLINLWRNQYTEPFDANQQPIIDIDLITRPGTYLLPRSTVIDPVNVGKIPIYLRTNGNIPGTEFGVMLTVEAVYNDATDRVGLVQRLRTTQFAEHDNHLFERKRMEIGTPTWSAWWTVHTQLTVVAAIDLIADGNFVIGSYSYNVSNAIREPDGFIGNYHNSGNPLTNVYTIQIGDTSVDDEYYISATVNSQYSSYPNAETDTNGWVKTVYQFAIVDKQPNKFSFVVVGLNNDANGSNTFLSTNFSASIIAFGKRTVTAV